MGVNKPNIALCGAMNMGCRGVYPLSFLSGFTSGGDITSFVGARECPVALVVIDFTLEEIIYRRPLLGGLDSDSCGLRNGIPPTSERDFEDPRTFRRRGGPEMEMSPPT